MSQVGDLIRCPVDGEFGTIVDMQSEVEGMRIASGWLAYKIVWQGSPARSALQDALVEWGSHQDFVSLDKYAETQG